MTRTVVPVILSGGAGTRLWPISRETAPKPFMHVRGGTLLRRTFDRATHVHGCTHTLIVTNHAYAAKTRSELEGAGRGAFTMLLEPMARNTAPAVALAALYAARQFGEDAILVVLPADHLVEDAAAFGVAVDAAIEAAAAGYLALFGVEPTAPETGFGYMQVGAPIDGLVARKVLRFVEKPDRPTAESYLATGGYLWNSGMFCFSVRSVLEALRAHAPEIMQRAGAALDKSKASDGAVALDAEAFAALPNISIDYAVMERAANVAAVQCKIGWSDIGSWNAVAETVEVDKAGNAAEGNATLVDSRNTYVRSTGRLVAAVGVQDLVVVETPDAVLVTHKGASQRVKAVVDDLKSKASPLATEHVTVERPWGTYTTLNESERFKIKRIEVKPGGRLSLQMHHHRSEHWVVVSGAAKVTCNDKEFLLSPNESTFIPVGARHRLENPGKLPLVMIEVQCGDYVGEDDIVRFSDQYGRVP
ncbi:MAG TPA: mannose-1-phosphate guanylyltransferase/mannose-6-phosphate isomerase [Burkholderiaceae bacterium]|nr:mannose-1-phosphate guanylyltransferase/mannose-6-phosphate isomerase [Burkholderiaceae bacterium]